MIRSCGWAMAALIMGADVTRFSDLLMVSACDTWRDCVRLGFRAGLRLPGCRWWADLLAGLGEAVQHR
jgi:hypothetical protein